MNMIFSIAVNIINMLIDFPPAFGHSSSKPIYCKYTLNLLI